MEYRFDELAKAVAEGMTRRELVSRVGGVLAGGVLAVLGMGTARAGELVLRCTVTYYSTSGIYTGVSRDSQEAQAKAQAKCVEAEGATACSSIRTVSFQPVQGL